MSRSIKKYPFTKYHDHPWASWKEAKKWVHRYNRNRYKHALRNGREPLPDLCLNYFDWDFIKSYYGVERINGELIYLSHNWAKKK